MARIGRRVLVQVPLIENALVGVGRDPKLRLVGHDVARAGRIVKCRRRGAGVDADLADRVRIAAVVRVVRIAGGIAGHRDMRAFVKMADLMREACVVADDAASRLDAATAVDLLLAGRDHRRWHHPEDDIAEPEERREDARHREIRDQRRPRGVAAAGARRDRRERSGAVLLDAEDRGLEIRKGQHALGEAGRAEHGGVARLRGVAVRIGPIHPHQADARCWDGEKCHYLGGRRVVGGGRTIGRAPDAHGEGGAAAAAIVGGHDEIERAVQVILLERRQRRAGH